MCFEHIRHVSRQLNTSSSCFHASRRATTVSHRRRNTKITA
ncbi:unnamed protein product [Nippostrongylus brasiliensis]|uniref:Uncharacterized protein n=1 Tax=Nippostrongylus brasiliensis TaxID=27835 RepID=A0A0N4XKE8_NIPBR|nr:unnamed protein product [Nippostrongylus brasiliensis]